MTAPAHWLPRAIRVTDGDRSTVVAAWSLYEEGNLAVAQLTTEYFGVTHVPSGAAIAKCYVTRGAAEALLQDLLRQADWSRDGRDLAADADVDALVRRARADVYQRELRGEFGPPDFAAIQTANQLSARLEEIQPTRELGQKARLRGRRRG